MTLRHLLALCPFPFKTFISPHLSTSNYRYRRPRLQRNDGFCVHGRTNVYMDAEMADACTYGRRDPENTIWSGKHDLVGLCGPALLCSRAGFAPTGHETNETMATFDRSKPACSNFLIVSLLSHRMYSLISFGKSSPPQNRQLVVY